MKEATVRGPHQAASKEPTIDTRESLYKSLSHQEAKLSSNKYVFLFHYPLLYMHHNPEKDQ